MANIVLLFVCLLTGACLRAMRRVPENAHAALNEFIVLIALPCLIVSQLHNVHLTQDLLWPVMMPWLLFGLSAGIFAGISSVAHLSSGTTGALIMSAGLANTSFIGLPMIETFYGARGLPTGIMIDQLGTYLVLGTLGTVVACVYSNNGASVRSIARRILVFPPLIALAVALATSSVAYPDWIMSILTRLGATLAPLALFSVFSICEGSTCS